MSIRNSSVPVGGPGGLDCRGEDRNRWGERAIAEPATTGKASTFAKATVDKMAGKQAVRLRRGFLLR
jgi:hypothetical protein